MDLLGEGQPRYESDSVPIAYQLLGGRELDIGLTRGWVGKKHNVHFGGGRTTTKESWRRGEVEARRGRGQWEGELGYGGQQGRIAEMKEVSLVRLYECFA